MTPEQLQKLNASTVAATTAFDKQQVETRILSNQPSASGTVQPGDLLIVATPEPIAAWWCAVFAHSKNQDLWFMVPGDEFSLCGSADWPVPQCQTGGLLNFRCGCGVWAHQNDLIACKIVARLDAFHVEAIRDRLAQIAENRLIYAPESAEADDSYDYDEWMQQVLAASESWSAMIDASHSPATVYLANSADRTWLQQVQASETSLAASTVPASNDVAPGIVIRHDGPGTLVAFANDQGVRLRLSGTTQSPLVLAGEFSKRKVEWTDLSELFVTDTVPWQDDAVFFLIGSQKLVVQR